MTIRQGDNPADESKYLAMRVATREQRIEGAVRPNFEGARHSINVLYMRLMFPNRRGAA